MHVKISFWIVTTVLICADSATPAEFPAALDHGAFIPTASISETRHSQAQPPRKWLYQKTTNFRVWTSGSESHLKHLCAACESMRTHLRSAWLGKQDDVQWIPPCDVVVHATIADYVRHLGPGSEQTSGCSSIELESGKVVVRRIDLRADATAWLTESLPHELTHVVLADRFSTRQISRWADEGMAILAEPLSKQSLRTRDLKAALADRRTIRTSDLLVLNTNLPSQFRAAFYGQSTSLVKFLVDRGTPAKFVDFIDNSMVHGHDRALRELYGINGIAELDLLWRTGAGGHVDAGGVHEISPSTAFSRRIADIAAPQTIAANP